MLNGNLSPSNITSRVNPGDHLNQWLKISLVNGALASTLVNVINIGVIVYLVFCLSQVRDGVYTL